ncbi:Flp pilus assembly protein CpaB [Actinomadura viridis]|uniref:Flp pilus assembly protein CpaB n=1 Tax=Actinomadura viridis TaxID=58110 RepID=UPI0036A39ABA
MSGRPAGYRRPLAALAAAAGTGFALLALQPDPAPGRRIVVAARDLPGGATLRPGDLRTVTVPAPAVPAGAVTAPAAGRVLSGPMRRGEPLTDLRLASGGLLRGQAPGTVATPVRIADAAAVRLLRAGDRVDVLAAPDPDLHPDPRARLVVAAVPVITVPRQAGQADQGALVVLATDRSQAAALAGAGTRLALAIARSW